MKTFSQFVNEATGPYSRARYAEINDLKGYKPDRNRDPFHGVYDPPPEHDKLHDTFEQARREYFSKNPRGDDSEHALSAYKKVREVHGEEGLKKLIGDHKQMGPSREKDEALIKLRKEK